MSAIETNLAIEAAVRLGTLIAAHARDVGRRLGDSLRRWLRHGEVLPDFTLVLELPARSVRHAARACARARASSTRPGARKPRPGCGAITRRRRCAGSWSGPAGS